MSEDGAPQQAEEVRPRGGSVSNAMSKLVGSLRRRGSTSRIGEKQSDSENQDASGEPHDRSAGSSRDVSRDASANVSHESSPRDDAGRAAEALPPRLTAPSATSSEEGEAAASDPNVARARSDSFRKMLSKRGSVSSSSSPASPNGSRSLPVITPGSPSASPLASPLFGRRSVAAPSAVVSMASGGVASVSNAEDGTDAGPLLKAGTLVFLDSRKKIKSRHFTLTSTTLTQQDDPVNRQLLREVVALTLERSVGVPNAFQLQNMQGKKVLLGCEDENMLHEWVLLINGACVLFHDSLGVLSHQVRVKLMRDHFCERYSGGTAKRDEEEWQYRKSGAVLLQGEGAVSTYQWDGLTLEHVKGPHHGKGVWDGLTLAWFPLKDMELAYERTAAAAEAAALAAATATPTPGKKKGAKKRVANKKHSLRNADEHAADGLLAEAPPAAEPVTGEAAAAPSDLDKAADVAYAQTPSMQFLWSAVDNSYTWLDGTRSVADDARNWKWSRHFLTKVRGIGHWIAEGSVPAPLVMLLQMMRYQRMGFEDADVAVDPALVQTPPKTKSGDDSLNASKSGDGLAVARKSSDMSSKGKSEGEVALLASRRKSAETREEGILPQSSSPAEAPAPDDDEHAKKARKSLRKKKHREGTGTDDDSTTSAVIPEDSEHKSELKVKTKGKRKGHSRSASRKIKDVTSSAIDPSLLAAALEQTEKAGSPVESVVSEGGASGSSLQTE